MKFKFDPRVLERIRADMEAIDQETNRKRNRDNAESAPAEERNDKPQHFGPCIACDGGGLDKVDPSKLCEVCEGSGKVLRD